MARQKKVTSPFNVKINFFGIKIIIWKTNLQAPFQRVTPMYRPYCTVTASTTNAPAAEVVFWIFWFEKAREESQDLRFDSQWLRNVNRWYMRNQNARLHKDFLVLILSPWFLQAPWDESVFASGSRLFCKDVAKIIIEIGIAHLYQSENIQHLKIKRNWQCFELSKTCPLILHRCQDAGTGSILE